MGGGRTERSRGLRRRAHGRSRGGGAGGRRACGGVLGRERRGHERGRVALDTSAHVGGFPADRAFALAFLDGGRVEPALALERTLGHAQGACCAPCSHLGPCL